MKKYLAIFIVIVVGLFLFSASAFCKDHTVAMVVKNLGNPFMDACGKGAKEALDELGDTLIFQGPATPTVEGQIEIIENLIAQKVDAICITANDFDALVPVLKKAMDNGIKVVSFDSAVNAGGRIVHVNQADSEQIGKLQVQAIAEMIGYEGEIAILSAGATMTNQNTWIEFMKKELEDPKYEKMKLVTIVYGDDLRDKSYNEAMGLFKSYPNLKGIISPTTVGISATAKAIYDAGLVGKIKLTGLGLPSEMAEWIHNDTCTAMFLWNPIDLGYLAAYVAGLLCHGDITGSEGEKFTGGKMGEYTIVKAADGGTEVLLGPPFRFDKSNIDDWKDVY
ncbi:MAG: rhamnose ABC transporter substrate-binding protein [Candidatus Atribacteria bacterium]|nr:rhamnose ABC transporter substrate-binding protein [Candidatus Atribacteria bacterium]